MQRIFNLRRMRFTATALLFLWLLGLGMSVAHACLVDSGQGPHEQVVATEAPAAVDTHDPSGQSACQKFCIAEQTAALKQKGIDADLAASIAQAGLLSAWPGLATPTSHARIPVATVGPAWPAPSVFIRLQRLNL